jgi:hypothetical protein
MRRKLKLFQLSENQEAFIGAAGMTNSMVPHPGLHPESRSKYNPLVTTERQLRRGELYWVKFVCVPSLCDWEKYKQWALCIYNGRTRYGFPVFTTQMVSGNEYDLNVRVSVTNPVSGKRVRKVYDWNGKLVTRMRNVITRDAQMLEANRS